MRKPSKSTRLKRAAFRAVRANEPERVHKTRVFEGNESAERQIRAIALDAARSRGARIGRPK